MADLLMRAADQPIKHGYTLGDLDSMTAAAVKADRLLAMDYTERWDIARSAIAYHLCAAEEPPQRQELVRVGWQAIYRHVRDGLRQRGWADGDRDWSSGVPTMPRFEQYWGTRVVPSHEDRIVEKLAVDQVMPTLGEPYRDAVVALGAFDDYPTAAQSLGLNRSAFSVRMTTARRQFLRRWFEGETPHRPRRTDRRVESHSTPLPTHCGKGHEWTPENTHIRHRIVRGKTKHERVCRSCEHDRSVARVQARRAVAS